MWALAVCVMACHPYLAAAQSGLIIFGDPAHSPGYVPAEMTSWCTEHMCWPKDIYTLVVGERVDLNVTAAHVSGNVTTSVLANPGMPSGCHVTASETHEMGHMRRAVMRRFSFTPIPGQEGITYKICIKATNVINATDSHTKCIQLDVRAPHVAFKPETASTVERTVGVNCPVLLRLLPYDAGNQGYCMQVRAGKISNPSEGSLPPGAQLTYVGTATRDKKGSHDGCEHDEWLLAWYPTRGQEPSTYTYCVHGEDKVCIGDRCTQRARELCFTVHVVKCKYCLSIGETIMHAAARYKSDWLQIWGANPHIVSPDAIPAWTSLQLGPMYSVRAGDTLEDIATRFGTTSNNLLEANPDIQVSPLFPPRCPLLPSTHHNVALRWRVVCAGWQRLTRRGTSSRWSTIKGSSTWATSCACCHTSAPWTRCRRPPAPTALSTDLDRSIRNDGRSCGRTCAVLGRIGADRGGRGRRTLLYR